MGWDQFDDDPQEYHTRRDSLGADAPGVITFEKKTMADAQANAGGVAGLFAEGMKACIGLGAGNFPDGRAAAYAQVNYPLGGAGAGAAEKRKVFGPCPNASSCGTFIRGMWQLFGIGAPINGNNRQLRSAYQDDTVLAQLGLYGADAGGLHGDLNGEVARRPVSATGIPLAASDLAGMQPGDVLFLGGTHIFTLVEKPRPWKKIGNLQLWEGPAVEAGQGPFFGDALGRQNGDPASGDGGCRGIKANTYTLAVNGSHVVVSNNDGTQTQIFWWVEFAKLVAQIVESYVWVPRVHTKLPGVP